MLHTNQLAMCKPDLDLIPAMAEHMRHQCSDTIFKQIKLLPLIKCHCKALASPHRWHMLAKYQPPQPHQCYWMLRMNLNPRRETTCLDIRVWTASRRAHSIVMDIQASMEAGINSNRTTATTATTTVILCSSSSKQQIINHNRNRRQARQRAERLAAEIFLHPAKCIPHRCTNLQAEMVYRPHWLITPAWWHPPVPVRIIRITQIIRFIRKFNRQAIYRTITITVPDNKCKCNRQPTIIMATINRIRHISNRTCHIRRQLKRTMAPSCTTVHCISNRLAITSLHRPIIIH